MLFQQCTNSQAVFTCNISILYKFLFYTEILEVNLFAFAYRLFHEDFSLIYEIYIPRLQLEKNLEENIERSGAVLTIDPIHPEDITADMALMLFPYDDQTCLSWHKSAIEIAELERNLMPVTKHTIPVTKHCSTAKIISVSHVWCWKNIAHCTEKCCAVLKHCNQEEITMDMALTVLSTWM